MKVFDLVVFACTVVGGVPECKDLSAPWMFGHHTWADCRRQRSELLSSVIATPAPDREDGIPPHQTSVRMECK